MNKTIIRLIILGSIFIVVTVLIEKMWLNISLEEFLNRPTPPAFYFYILFHSLANLCFIISSMIGIFQLISLIRTSGIRAAFRIKKIYLWLWPFVLLCAFYTLPISGEVKFITSSRVPTQAEIKKLLGYGLSQDGHAIRIPVGKILLIRQGNKYGAIKITKSGDDFAEYEWYYQADGTGNFTLKTATHGTGKVFEKYKHIPIWPKRYLVIDDGSQLYIKFSDFGLEWSQSDWIYFPEEIDAKNPIEMALTEESDTHKIDVKSPELKFFKRR